MRDVGKKKSIFSYRFVTDRGNLRHPGRRSEIVLFASPLVLSKREGSCAFHVLPGCLYRGTDSFVPAAGFVCDRCSNGLLQPIDSCRFDSILSLAMRGGTGGSTVVEGHCRNDWLFAAATRDELVVALLLIGVKTLDTWTNESAASAAARGSSGKNFHFYKPFAARLGRRRNAFGVIRRFPTQSGECKLSKGVRGKGQVCSESEDGLMKKTINNKSAQPQEVSC